MPDQVLEDMLRLVIGPLSRQAHCHRLEHAAQTVDLLNPCRGEVCNAGADMLVVDRIALGHQALQRLADGRQAHALHLGKLIEGDALSGSELARLNLPPK